MKKRKKKGKKSCGTVAGDGHVIFLLLCVQVWGSQSLLCLTWWTSSVSSSPQREETSSKVWLAGHVFCAQRKTQPLECKMFSHTLYSVCPPPKSELKWHITTRETRNCFSNCRDSFLYLGGCNWVYLWVGCRYDDIIFDRTYGTLQSFLCSTSLHQ